MSWYAIIPPEILARKDITANHKLVVGVIISLSKQKGHCFASNDYIAELIGKSDSLVRAILLDLINLDLISRELLYKPNGELDKRLLKAKVTVGKIGVPPASPLSPPCQPAVTPPASPLAHNNKEVIIKNNKVNDIPFSKPKKDPLIGFEEFWNLYDKKTGKDKAMALWAKLKESEKELIMTNIPLYKKAKPDKTYRKDPERYLKHRVWEDEIILPNQTLEEKNKTTNGVPAPPAIAEIEIPNGY